MERVENWKIGKILIKWKIQEVVSGEVFSMIEEVYGRVQYIGEEGRLRKYKESNNRVWEKAKCRS